MRTENVKFIKVDQISLNVTASTAL